MSKYVLFQSRPPSNSPLPSLGRLVHYLVPPLAPPIPLQRIPQPKNGVDLFLPRKRPDIHAALAEAAAAAAGPMTTTTDGLSERDSREVVSFSIFLPDGWRRRRAPKFRRFRFSILVFSPEAGARESRKGYGWIETFAKVFLPRESRF